MSIPEYREPSGCSPYLLMALGGMIAVLCGGCTVMVVRSGDELSQLGYFFGGAPTLLGVAMFFVGWFQSRRKGDRK